MGKLFLWLCTAISAMSVAATADVAKHESGRCAMRGECGKESFFGSQLPCPDNGLATEPSSDERAKLVSICGERWSSGAVCCDEAQMDSLSSNLKKADGLIASCPACRENFYNLFCTFTCSPDQSTFVNITDTVKSNTGEKAVMELDNLWADEYKTKLFDSCKEVKLGATGGRAMQLIGGGAKNGDEFVDFLGHKSTFGSPFQINFPHPGEKGTEGLEATNPIARACNDPDERFRCACVDCPDSCAKLPALEVEDSCHVGSLPCLSFAAVLLYSVFLALLVTAIVGHVAYRRHTRRQHERLRLLQDADADSSDGEGDDDDDSALLMRGAGLFEKPQRSHRLNNLCDRAFARLGGACARYPFFTIGASLLVVLLLSLGWLRFEVERDPVRLWVSPESPAAQEKQYFDDKFGPFYRAEQAFLANDTGSENGPVMSYETLEWWFGVEKKIRTGSFDNVTLDDICFNPTGKACVIQSLTSYFDWDFSKIKENKWEKQISACAEEPTSCLPPFDLPLEKNVLFGGYEEGDSILSATSLITTWVVSNHQQGSDEEKRAQVWEAGMREVMKQAQKEAHQRGLRVSFSTESSLEQELNQTANTDANIVVISYIIMFIYASFALGSASLSFRAMLNSPVSAVVHSKFTLGISGIVIVLMSVSASVGLFSAMGIKVTLIIAEVIPFLVLAVGVDNIFLIVHEFERINNYFPDEEIDSRISKALGRMGPSILLSASTETIAFVLGVFVGMPAVRNFAAYAAGAVLINAILQVTMFVAVLALDQKRRESNRVDCFPFLKVAYQTNAVGNFIDEDEGPLQIFLRRHYAPVLLKRQVKVAVVTIFLGIFAAGVALIPEVQLGLDQRLAIPDGSYLIDYFNDIYAYLNVGPPVYFVARGVNAAKRPQQEAICSRFTTCEPYSLANVLELEAKRSDVSYITGATANWFDDFFFWLNPDVGECCKEHGRSCFANRDEPWNITLYGMPEGAEFIDYAKKWLAAPSNADCPLGGKAPYSQAVVIDSVHETIETSNFRTSHTPLRSQEDFIASYLSARRISEEISDHVGIDVFPYSIHYIFFDQYVSIQRLAGTLLGSAAALIFLVASVLLGSLATGAVVTLTVTMIVADIMGTMALAGVSLNALSLVNLVISVGIGVEFCAHVARAFAFPSGRLLEKARLKYRGRDARAWASLVNVGGSVISGITITKLVGVSVLAFTRSKIFEVYYFRVWLALVIWAALHALVFLPVALSLVGGEGFLEAEAENGLNGDLSSRRYRALIADDDDSDEDY